MFDVRVVVADVQCVRSGTLVAYPFFGLLPACAAFSVAAAMRGGAKRLFLCDVCSACVFSSLFSLALAAIPQAHALCVA